MTWLNAHRPIVGGVAALAIVTLAGLVFPDDYRLLSQILIFALFAASLNLSLGYGGMPSLGHALYLGVGAYTTGIIIKRYTESFWLVLPSAVLMSALVAAVAGLPVLRTKGAYFIMITFAFGQLGVVFAEKARWLTGGFDGMPGIFRPTFPGIGTGLDDERNYYVFTALLVLAVLGFIALLVYSPFGTTTIGIRENEERMQALGFNVWLHRYVVFVLAGTLAGFAGVLLVYLNGFVSADTMNLTVSAEGLVMVVLGGAGTLLGPVVGAGLILVVRELTKDYGSHWQTILGLVYILTVYLARRGVVPALRQTWKRVRG